MHFFRLAALCRWLFVSIGAGALLSAASGGDKPLSREELERRFAAHSPDLILLRQEEKLVAAEYRAGAWLPQVRLGLGQGRGEPLSGEPSKPLWELGLGLELPNPLAWSARRRADAAGTQARRLALELQVRSVWSSFREGLDQLEGLERREAVLHQRLERAERMLQVVGGRVAAGEARAMDQLRLRVEQRRLQGALAALQAEKTGLTGQLRVSLGLSVPEPDPSLLLEDPPPPPGEAGACVKDHPLVELRRAGSDEARWRQRQYRMQSWLEGVDLEGGRGREMDGRIWKAHLGVRIPLTGVDGREASLWRLRRQQSLLETQKEERRLAVERDRLWQTLQARWKTLKALGDEGRQEARAQMDVAEEGYRLGEYGLLAVLDAQEAAWALEEDWITACLAYRQAWNAWKDLQGEHS